MVSTHRIEGLEGALYRIHTITVEAKVCDTKFRARHYIAAIYKVYNFVWMNIILHWYANVCQKVWM